MAYDAFIPEKKIAGTVAVSPVPKNTTAATMLAYLAAAPLVGAALTMVAIAPHPMPATAQFMALYGAALIVFLGGVRWGVAVMKPGGPTMRSLLGAVLPLLLALPLFLPGAVQWKFLAIMVLVAALLFDDLKATQRGSGAPTWYLGVRVPLSVLIEIAFLTAITVMV